MSKPSLFRIWVSAARLRTLPLSVAGIVVGNALAIDQHSFSWILFGSTLLTAIAFQILSNFANDYGDGVKGTDNEQRIGPKRVLQQQLLSHKALFRGIVLTAIISLGLAITTIFLAFGADQLANSLLFLGLALAAIIAAYKYTAGTGAYGYHAMGDVFVFLFFGFLAVCGAYYVQNKALNASVWWMASALGFLSVGVLNLNNMRDIENDTAVGKKTVATILGLASAKKYHTLLILLGIICLGVGLATWAQNLWQYLPLLVIIPLGIQMVKTTGVKKHADFDAFLKPLAIITFMLSLIVFASQYFF